MMIGEKDEEGIKLSIDYVAGLVQKEIDAGIPATRIIVGGFSQVYSPPEQLQNSLTFDLNTSMD